MPRILDKLDTELLSAIQESFPLVERPFAALADQVGTTEQDVLDRVAALKAKPAPVIRQISAIFDSKALGYQSSLVAARVEESNLDAAVAVINAHPGVSHNYRRNHAFNLWYTIAVPPDSTLGLQRSVDILHEQSGALATRLMPTLKLFKIGVRLNLAGGADITAATDAKPHFGHAQQQQAMAHVLSDTDKRMIRVLQQDLPIIPRPYDEWAVQAGVRLEQLFAAARVYESQHRMRRFSAVLRHREVGFSANAMGCWPVPENQIESFGQAAASFNAVSHCYLRPTYPDWPYNLFTMVHAPTPDDCHAVLRAIADRTGVSGYTALFSSQEYKKVRVRYFLGDIEQWEAAHRR